MNGQAKQKKFPATSRTSTSAPRKCTQLIVVARFLGASDGPKKPCRIINTLSNRRGIWKSVRACRHRSSRPRSGVWNKSNALLFIGRSFAQRRKGAKEDAKKNLASS